jgi:hypothetical protein
MITDRKRLGRQAENNRKAAAHLNTYRLIIQRGEGEREMIHH